MKASVVYEVYKALSDEEKGNFMTLVQNDEFNKKTDTRKRKRTKKVLITEKEAIDYLLKNVFSKPQKHNS